MSPAPLRAVWLADVTEIPVAALHGDNNIVTPSVNMEWYGGPTLLEYIEAVLAAATALRHRGAQQVVLAPHVLATGILPDRLFAGARHARLDAAAQVIDAAPEVVTLTIERHDAVMDLRASA